MSWDRVCTVCDRVLNQPNDPSTRDCGGDCLRCMADAGDPDCALAMWRLIKQGSLVLLPARPTDAMITALQSWACCAGYIEEGYTAMCKAYAEECAAKKES